jgi:Flp pilus assembly protein TadG
LTQEFFMKSFNSGIRSFAREQSGGIAILFAISLFMLFGFTALAVDFARGQSTKSALQQDLDATLLYVGTEVSKQPEGLDPQAMAQTYMDGLRRAKQAEGAVLVTLTQPDAKSFIGDAVAQVPASLAGLFGIENFEVGVRSEAQIGQQPVEFALVLDNTLSMNGPKLDTLKSAASTLVETIFQGLNADQFVKASVVPFAEYVNVGQSHRNAPWMSVPADTSTTTNVCQDVQPATVVPGSCHDVSYGYVQDGVPMTGTSTQCDYTYGPPVHQCSDVTNTTTWNGCAGSRNYPLNVKDENYATKVPGIMNVWCPNEITALSNQKDTVKAAINAMNATGNTYLPAGLMWGWATLSKDAPYAEAEDVKDGQNVRKIMVLMTDGFNTLSPTVPYDGTHWGSDTVKANALTAELCANIKAAKVEIYSVAFEVTDATIKSVLENCASNPSNFYDAADPTALHNAFEKIAADFSPLRLTR